MKHLFSAYDLSAQPLFPGVLYVNVKMVAVFRRAVEEVWLRGTETFEPIRKKKAKDLRSERALFPYNLLLCCRMSPNPVLSQGNKKKKLSH